MNDQLARTLFMEYLYDEISAEDQAKLESYLDKNPGLRQELSELRETRSLLQQMPDPDTPPQLLVMDPRNRTLLQWCREARQLLPHSLLGKSALAVAAGLILLLVVGSVAQLQVDASGDGVAISMGGSSPEEGEGLTAVEAEVLADEIRRENAVMMADYTEAINRQHRQQLQQLISYFQQQRIDDLQLVDQTLDAFQQTTHDRLLLTNRYLGEVLQTVRLQDQDQSISK
ncbi:hypothetical protein SAMN05443144_11374 [Fodinibius roseus]|uniref:Zinc-finger domain-containing protein n=1 Tax=Fodinibius roseus TaxID=1194090 RepID=A0A1M5EJ45_9BACT|nr:hypothetical protein [Fodinibius roseus]SHF79186.1 hypothetical protein SAMN05443144_11374 [Fodinibius roseus]